MRAMILAAGLGTRLRPLTMLRPKVLAPVMGIPVLDFWVSRLHKAGCESVIVNAFHLHEKLVAAVKEKKWPIPVHVEVEHEILGTGGGIGNVLDFFGEEDFVVINGDIICDARLETLYRRHVESKSAVSLLMHDFPVFNNVAVDKSGVVLEFGEAARRSVRKHGGSSLMAFTGIHVINPRALSGVPRGTYADIIEEYRKLFRNGREIRALQQPRLFWREMGSLQSYLEVHRTLSRMQWDSLQPLPTGSGAVIHPEARVEASAVLKGFAVVGRGSHVAKSAVIEDSVLWDKVRVSPGGTLRNCIVADGMQVEGFHEDETLVGAVG